MSDEVIDVAAREYTTAVRNELKGDLAALAARVRALEAKPAGGGLNRDEVWQLILDGIYAQLTTPGTLLYAATHHEAEDAEARLLALVERLRIGLIVERR